MLHSRQLNHKLLFDSMKLSFSIYLQTKALPPHQPTKEKGPARAKNSIPLRVHTFRRNQTGKPQKKKKNGKFQIFTPSHSFSQQPNQRFRNKLRLSPSLRKLPHSSQQPSGSGKCFPIS